MHDADNASNDGPWPIFADEMGALPVPALGEPVAEQPAGGSRPRPAPNWRTLDAATTEKELADLADWVDWFVDRYALRSVVPPCWVAHGAMTEELSALAAAWRGAYEADDAAPEAGLLWHERLDAWRTRWANWNIDNCNINNHRPTLDVMWPDAGSTTGGPDTIHPPRGEPTTR
jgi:hypothetical protein